MSLLLAGHPPDRATRRRRRYRMRSIDTVAHTDAYREKYRRAHRATLNEALQMMRRVRMAQGLCRDCERDAEPGKEAVRSTSEARVSRFSTMAATSQRHLAREDVL